MFASPEIRRVEVKLKGRGRIYRGQITEIASPGVSSLLFRFLSAGGRRHTLYTRNIAEALLQRDRWEIVETVARSYLPPVLEERTRGKRCRGLVPFTLSLSLSLSLFLLEGMRIGSRGVVSKKKGCKRDVEERERESILGIFQSGTGSGLLVIQGVRSEISTFGSECTIADISSACKRTYIAVTLRHVAREHCWTSNLPMRVNKLEMQTNRGSIRQE